MNKEYFYKIAVVHLHGSILLIILNYKLIGIRVHDYEKSL